MWHIVSGLRLESCRNSHWPSHSGILGKIVVRVALLIIIGQRFHLGNHVCTITFGCWCCYCYFEKKKKTFRSTEFHRAKLVHFSINMLRLLYVLFFLKKNCIRALFSCLTFVWRWFVANQAKKKQQLIYFQCFVSSL